MKKLDKETIIIFLKKIGIKLGKDGLKFLFKFCEVILVFMLFVMFLNWSNDSLIITEDIYINKNIPNKFDEYKILQISDVNGKNISKELVKKTEEIKPDIIVITGDFINSERSNLYNVDLSYFEHISNTYPTYFITGEQEQDSNFFSDLKPKLEKLGVKVLTNEKLELIKDGDKINLIGMNDSSFFIENLTEFNYTLSQLVEKENFNLLLSHRPELINIYTENNIELVLSGHALGGQIKIPFVGELYSSNQGFYPDFTSGFYKQNNTTVYVSRGIGNTFIPIRLFNRPEINVITLSVD